MSDIHKNYLCERFSFSRILNVLAFRFQHQRIWALSTFSGKKVTTPPKSVNQSINQSINQSVSQSINQASKQAGKQEKNQSINQSINQSTLFTLEFTEQHLGANILNAVLHFVLQIYSNDVNVFCSDNADIFCAFRLITFSQ